jgi:hypothetical protein
VRRGYVTLFKITVRADDVELRGYMADEARLVEFAKAVKPFGWIVVGSVAENQDETPVKLFQAAYHHE